MALTSPGVEVTVIDESFYTPSEPGTVPLIIVATAQDKSNAAGTDLAAATTKANAGRAFKLTSQRDLVEFFGVPNFEKTASSTPIHGSELNEYGLLAAYSFLGVSNSAFMVRADVDLKQLEGQSTAPGADPKDGTWWVDTQSTAWGIQEWNGAPATTIGGQRFTYKAPIVLTNDDASRITGSPAGPAPKESVGSIGDYCVVFETEEDQNGRIFYKSAGSPAGILPGEWVLVGSNRWAASNAAYVSDKVASTFTSSTSIFINGILINVGTNIGELVAEINSNNIPGVFASQVGNYIYMYTDGANDLSGDSSKSNAIVIEYDNATIEIGLLEGTYYGPELQQSPHTSVPRWKSKDSEPRPTGSVWIKTTEPNNGARWRVRNWNDIAKSWELIECPLYSTTHEALYALDRSGGGYNLPLDVLFTQYNSDENNGYDATPETAIFKIWRRNAVNITIIKSIAFPGVGLPSGIIEFTMAASVPGQSELESTVISVDIGTPSIDTPDDIAAAINAADLTGVEANVTVEHELEIIHKTGGDIRLSSGTAGIIATIFATSPNFYPLPVAVVDYNWLATNWTPLLSGSDVFVSDDEPLSAPYEGQLWYNPEFSDVDLMIHNGDTWVGYRNEYPNTNVDGPIVAVSEPEGPFVNNDIWISTADLENYPLMYRWNEDLQEWNQLDTTDQVSEDGVLFADARYGVSGETGNTEGAIKELLESDYLDPDAPDPALYPRGMLLWNLRRSGGNVKKYNIGYIDTAQDNVRFDPQNTGGESMINYEVNRWSTASPNNEDGSGSFGRNAQRAVVIQAMKSVVDTSSEIRDEERRNFNIIAAPGYTELMSNIVNLNIDRGLTAFVVGDVPFRLPADATSLLRWGTNENLVFDNGDDGVVTYDEYLSVFYPSGFTTDLSGSNAVVPSSHMMLRTIALSDQVSYPWFAPAGTRRGGITNATAVGYIDADTGEFQVVSLNEGQRDTLYEIKVNPITFFNGVGLVNYGQRTRARNASALDRINVSRLVVYLRSQLNKLARPYIFEPNDKITRDEIKQSVESLLLELVGLRALYDFAVVCDESNNTPTRVDRNELWVDIAIEPVKAIEFIYIPIRVKNTGEI